MIKLFDFQQAASDAIADRFLEYIADPAVTGTKLNQRTVPFFQALASLTASGKTVILADAVSSIAEALPVPPIVLWLSKGKVVVQQSFANLAGGGKYHHLLGSAEVRALADFNGMVPDDDRALVLFATVGTFNQKDKEDGNLLIYRSEVDTADDSTWGALKKRPGSGGVQRPLLIVYDEAHNLSDQQTDLLMELEPDGFLVASATMRLPARLRTEVDELRRNGRDDEWLITAIDPKQVADAELVKSTVLLAGYKAPMEETVSALLSDFKDAEAQGDQFGLDGHPKAIYVCKTNIVEGDAFQKDDPDRPFNQREAPPILIWRYLTQAGGVDPDQIAVYCSLTFKKAFPPPDEFVHFKGGDNDYADFSAGDFRHIIFNLSLQEGWDDPLCYFAYVDKSMESRVQVEQIIGRLLRQPAAKRYGAERLNTAHFYVRVDRNEVFTDLLGDVSRRLAADAPEIKVVKAAPDKTKPTSMPVKGHYEIPGTAYNSKHTQGPVSTLIDGLSDYRNDDGTNVDSIGARGTVKHELGVDGGGKPVSWEDFTFSNRVSARWVFIREVRRRFAGALEVADITDGKFDSKVGLGSKAFQHIVQVADDVADAYLDNVYLKQRKSDPYVVGPVLARTDQMKSFSNAVHEGYDGLNTLEEAFADELDATGHTWFRNPPRSGYGIPLVSPGATRTFYPDFIVWRGTVVVAVDTKGGHLLAEAATRKLLRIEPATGSNARLVVRFISPGEWTPAAEQVGKDGFTVWTVKPDGGRGASFFPELPDAVERVIDTTAT